MKIKKIIISVFLLCVYALAFAHSIMPHEHGFYSNRQIDKHNHSHTDNAIETGHLQHNNHCDKGIVDLILCVLNDFHQHSDDCKDEHIIFENSKRLASSATNDFNTYLDSNFKAFSNTINYVAKNSSSLDFEFCHTYNKLSQDNSPFRGPPVRFI